MKKRDTNLVSRFLYNNIFGGDQISLSDKLLFVINFYIKKKLPTENRPLTTKSNRYYFSCILQQFHLPKENFELLQYELYARKTYTNDFALFHHQ